MQEPCHRVCTSVFIGFLISYITLSIRTITLYLYPTADQILCPYAISCLIHFTFYIQCDSIHVAYHSQYYTHTPFPILYLPLLVSHTTLPTCYIIRLLRCIYYPSLHTVSYICSIQLDSHGMPFGMYVLHNFNHMLQLMISQTIDHPLSYIHRYIYSTLPCTYTIRYSIPYQPLYHSGSYGASAILYINPLLDIISFT